MKVVLRNEYGAPDVLRLEDIERPTPRAGEVLVKVCAVSLNASDWEFLTGQPLYARIHGVRTPRHKILGSDIAGVIEATGKNAGRFKVGDEIFGDIMTCMGGFAEFVCVPEKALTLKPTDLSFEDASCLPQAGAIALQGIRDKGRAQTGQKVLINGAGGGSGAFAIQLARMAGGEVTGVDNAHKQLFMQSMGADHVIDYRETDFAQTGARYDLILDLVATRSISACRQAMTSSGKYFAVGGPLSRILSVALGGPLRTAFSKQKMGLLMVMANRGMETLLELVASGALEIPIDRRFSLSETAEALSYLGEGRARGKIVVTICS